MRIYPAARALAVLCALLSSGLFLSCGGGGMSQLKKINITPANPTVVKGANMQLAAMGVFDDGTERALAASVTWQTSQSTIATVTTQGSVTGVAVGVTQVSALYQGITGNTAVTVGPPSLLTITVNPNASSLPKGESEQLTATGSFSDGSTQDLTQTATWQTSPSTVVAVSPQGNVTGIGQGAAQVSAVYQGATGTAAVAVGAPALLSVTVSPNPSSLPTGETEQLIATGNFSDGTTQNLTQSATWNSSAPATASVSSTGATVANAMGTATISATAGSVVGSASLTVTAVAMTAINVTPATLNLVLGGNAPFQATATMSNGTTQDITATATWSSTQPSIATVSSIGMASALQIGSTTIQAQSNGLTGSASLTVVPLVLVNYYNRAAALKSGIDGTVRITNPGLTQGNLCAMVYVFDQDQELNECCGCSVSADGMRTLSVLKDLTANTLTGKKPRVGEIKIVPSDPTQNPQCNAGFLTPTSELEGWATHDEPAGGGTFQATEASFIPVQLSAGEASYLANLCGYAQQLGSGHGVCTCGTGD
jgi:hypothetical protein